jgi:hypothetical protein
MANKTKAHTRYYNSLGEQIAGITTITSVLDKPALVAWSNKLGLQGIDSTKYKDKLADVGSITHLRILHHLENTSPDLSEYAPADIKLSDNCMLSFYEWEKTHKLEPIALETPWVSAKYNYGGTEDFLGYINGRLEIMDFKTGGIYLSAILQAAALRQLAQELGHPVEHARILSIPRANNESFREELITRFDDEFEIFKNCLSIHNLLKKTGRRL